MDHAESRVVGDGEFRIRFRELDRHRVGDCEPDDVASERDADDCGAVRAADAGGRDL